MLAHKQWWVLHPSAFRTPPRPLPLILASSRQQASNSNPRISTTPNIFPRRALLDGCLASSFFSVSPPLMASENADGSLDDTNDWYRFRGDGFSLSIPPDFEDIMEPEDLTAGLSLYGERAKTKPFAARFASSDSLVLFSRSEVLSVVIRQSSQLKLTFFATKDVTDLGSLRDAANIFVPVGAKLYAAQTIKQTDAEKHRTYYYYEFSTGDKYIAMEAAASSGKVFVVGASAPKFKWKDDGRKLRAAAVSFSLS